MYKYVRNIKQSFRAAFLLKGEMNMNANNIFIINGNLTKAPILRQTENGKNFCYLNVAVDNGFGKDSKPDYITVTVWGKTAENAAQYLVKGQNVSICGSLSSYFDKEKKLHHNLTASDVQFGRKPQLSKDKEQSIDNDKKDETIEEPATEPEMIAPPESFFAEEPEEEPDI